MDHFTESAITTKHVTPYLQMLYINNYESQIYIKHIKYINISNTYKIYK